MQENQDYKQIVHSRIFNSHCATDQAFLKLAHQEPSIRMFLGNLYREAAKWEGKLPKGWTSKSVDKFWDSMTGEVKHKVTKCIKKMEGTNISDPGAFCAALADRVEGTAWRHEPRKAAAVDPQLQKAVKEFVLHAQRTIDDHFKKNYEGMEAPKLSIMWGRKYARIVKNDRGGRSVFGFVDTTNGDLLKAESWKRPARHARGNVYDKSTWQSSHSPWGMAYLRAANEGDTSQKNAQSISELQADKIRQVIEHHKRESVESREMADSIEKAWSKWDLRTLGNYQVLNRREMDFIKNYMKSGDSPTEDEKRYLGEIGQKINNHIKALRKESFEHRKEAEAIDRAWQKHDHRTLKRLRLLASDHVALNKYNAPEMLAALIKALEVAGLGDTVKELKQRGFMQIINKAWMNREKRSSLSEQWGDTINEA